MRAALTLKWAKRQAWTMRFRLLGIAAILGMAAGIFIGVYSCIDSLYNTRDRFYQQLQVADLEVGFVPADAANVPDISDIDGVDDWSMRLVSPGQLTLADNSRHAATVVTQNMADSGGLDQLQILKGKPLDREIPNQVLLERSFAEHFNVKPGDQFQLSMGNAEYDLTVAGIALSPEYLLAPSSPNYFVPLKGAMAVVFVPHRLIADRLNFSLVNSVRVSFDENVDGPLLSQNIRDRLAVRLQIDEVIPLVQQFSNLFLNVDLDAFAIFVPAIIIIFVLATIIVGLFLIARWVEAQRETLGVYMALGYAKKRLIFSQCFPMFAIAACAAIIAIPVAYLTLYDFGLIYADALGLPEPILRLETTYVILGLFGIVLCTFLMAAWPLVRILRLTPQRAVRGNAGNDSDNAAGGGFVMRQLGFLRHVITIFYPLRSLLRGHTVTTLTIVSIALALGVSLSYLIAGDSYMYTINKGFQRDNWQVSVGFMVPMWEDELSPFKTKKVEHMEGYLRGSVRLLKATQKEPALLTGIAAGDSLRQPNIVSGRALKSDDKNALMVEYNLAERLQLQPGSSVTVEHDDDHCSATVVAVFSGTTPGAVYAPIKSVQQWLAMDDQVSGLLLKTKGDVKAVAAQLRDMDRVASVTAKSELTRKVLELTSQILSMIYVTTAFSVVVALIILVSSTSFTVMERMQEYGILRVLGFSNRSVRSMLIIEVVSLACAGIVFSLPIGYVLARFLNSRLSEAWFMVMTDVNWSSFAIAWLPALVALPLAAIPSVRTVFATPLMDLLKQRRLG